MSERHDNRLVKTFAELRAAGKKTLIPFLTGGYPDMTTTAALLRDWERRGVRVCEVGFPFSDSIADGPTIQESYYAALDAGATSEGIFKTVADYRAAGGAMALVAMVSDSIVYRHSSEAFAAQAAEAGFDALLVPDMPLEETGAVTPAAEKHGLCEIMLIAPTTPPERRVEIACRSQGFVYFMSVAGITGERAALPPETLAAVAELRKHTDTPICVGFGISNAEMVAEVCRAADGAIVGSAIVKRIAHAAESGSETLADDIGAFVADLMSGTS